MGTYEECWGKCALRGLVKLGEKLLLGKIVASLRTAPAAGRELFHDEMTTNDLLAGAAGIARWSGRSRRRRSGVLINGLSALIELAINSLLLARGQMSSVLIGPCIHDFLFLDRI